MAWLALFGACIFLGAVICGFTTGRMRTVDPLPISGDRKENAAMFWVATTINLAWAIILIIAASYIGF